MGVEADTLHEITPLIKAYNVYVPLSEGSKLGPYYGSLVDIKFAKLSAKFDERSETVPWD